MDSQDLRNLQEAYINVYDIDEMALNPNSRFTTSAQRRNYAANQIGSKEFSARGGYAGLKAGGGQAALKSGSSVSDVLYAGQKAKQAKAQQDFASKINKPSQQQTAPAAKPMDDFAAGGGAAKMKATGMTRDQVIAQGKKNLANSYEPDMFDIILEYLVVEGYADTNENALVIMANMSEEWREDIMERENSPYEKASDAALDARYGYGRATGNKRSFGRAANRSSAAAALRAIRRGQRSGSGTSREAGADAVHQGWARTAKTSSDQTPEKKERRAKLADTPYSKLPEDEKEKDRVSFDAVRAVYNRNRGR